jgi:DNA processing protein
VENSVFADERIARATLTWLVDPGDMLMGQLVRAHGPVGALELIRSRRLPRFDDIPPRMDDLRALDRWHAQLERIPDVRATFEQLHAVGIRLICPGDTEWPGQLADLGSTQPYALWVRGQADLRFVSRRSVAITGARAATAYGNYVANQLAAGVAADGWTVISGGAYGIDASAHRGALTTGGTTIAVLPSGIDHPHPVGHTELFDGITMQGIIVSELPPGRLTSRNRSVRRSRIIAALAAGTVIVEASERSISLHTAWNAHGAGRPVGAVPGPVTVETSAGCNILIRRGQAVLVACAADVIDLIRGGETAAADRDPHPATVPEPSTGPGEEED